MSLTIRISTRLAASTTALVLLSALSVAAQAAKAPPAPQAATTKKPAAKAPADPTAVLTDAIKTAFKTAYPNATIKNASKEKEDGQVVYEIESIDSGMARDLMYKADGTVISYEEQIAESAVPAAVLTAVKARYPKATITLCEKVFLKDATNYELTLKGAAVSAVELTPEGKWISPKPAK